MVAPMNVLREFSADQADAFDRVAEALETAGDPDLHENLSRPGASGGRGSAGDPPARRGRARRCCWPVCRSPPRGRCRDGFGRLEGRRRLKDRARCAFARANEQGARLWGDCEPRRAGHHDQPYHLHTGLRPRIQRDRRMARLRRESGGEVEGMTRHRLDRAHAFYQSVNSVPGALAAAGLKGSDFIKGWKRRESRSTSASSTLYFWGFWGRASMLDEKQGSTTCERSSHARALRRPRAARPSASRARWSSRTCRDPGADPRPHSPAGLRQPDPRSRHLRCPTQTSSSKASKRGGRGGGGERRRVVLVHPCRGRQWAAPGAAWPHPSAFGHPGVPARL